ncbi:MAG: DNA double-strand break repair nuclease NurA [Methermicoccaceae archaeon]
MLNLAGVARELEAKRESLLAFEKRSSEELVAYRKRLLDLDWLRPELPRYCGARPIEEGELIVPFREVWRTREDALRWMDKALSNRAVACVDGSQIYAREGLGMPLGIVQSALVCNPHDGSEAKIEREVRLITPELFERYKVYAYSKELVDAMRFSLECEHVMGAKGSICLMDGSLVLSHISSLNESIRKVYIDAIKGLLSACEHRIPIAAFVDSSNSHDLVRMMAHCFEELPQGATITDAVLLRYAMRWGERTKVFLCDRDDRRYSGGMSTLDRYGRWADKICFFYIATSPFAPCRVEMPLWMYEQGLTDLVADVIRGETIIRGNYPDIVWRAHEAVVIKHGEYALFEQVLKSFCAQHGIELSDSAKDFHKRFEVV